MANKKGKFTTMFDEDEVKELAGKYQYWYGFGAGAIVISMLWLALIAYASTLVN